MNVLTYAPPTPSPGETLSPSPTLTTTHVPSPTMTQLPTTGTSEVAWGSLTLGGVILVAGVVAIVMARIRRTRTE